MRGRGHLRSLRRKAEGRGGDGGRAGELRYRYAAINSPPTLAARSAEEEREREKEDDSKEKSAGPSRLPAVLGCWGRRDEMTKAINATQRESARLSPLLWGLATGHIWFPPSHGGR